VKSIRLTEVTGFGRSSFFIETPSCNNSFLQKPVTPVKVTDFIELFVFGGCHFAVSVCQNHTAPTIRPHSGSE